MRCPICGNPDSVPKSGYRRGEFQLYSCSSCRVGFVQPLPSHEELRHYYSHVYGLAWKASKRLAKQPIHRDTEMIAGIIKEMLPAGRFICEIGCASGSLLVDLRRKGFQVKGFELSESVAAHARQEFRLDVEDGEIPYDLAGKFDVVIERHVLEHTRDPKEEICRIKRALRTGGIAIFAVPNFRSFASRICGVGWEWFSPPNHLLYFDNATIELLLRRNGFVVEALFSRRGDASNVIFALFKSIYKRARDRTLRTGFWTKSYADSPNLRLAYASYRIWMKLLEATTAVPYKLMSPITSIMNSHGLGEELWCVARKHTDDQA